jgi:carbamoyltransferase
MKIGLAISHDASVAITSDHGEIISAIGEERITRVKNHVGIPVESIKILTEGSDKPQINECIIGTHKNLSIPEAWRMVSALEKNPSNPPGKWLPVSPGQKEKLKLLGNSAHGIIQNHLKYAFPEVFSATKFTWENHHDSHLGCALGMSNNSEKLLVSLDGAGDGESGAIGIAGNGKFHSIARIKNLDSLGELYTAVTSRYNFKPGSHEGKITGLAAFGAHSEAVEILSKHVLVKSGQVKILHCNKLKDIVVGKIYSKLGIRAKTKMQLSEIVELAESQTSNYADLAFAVQKVLEKSVLELLEYWTDKTGISDVALAGGVFANVKLNQRISESEFIRDVQIFPNMGDGGIAVGGIWSQLAKRGELPPTKLFNHMYLAPDNAITDMQALEQVKIDPELRIELLSVENFSLDIAKSINNGLIAAFHTGQMEFGPRALGNRSLLIDPRRGDLVSIVNKRLKRTEFMPFAPIVMEEKFGEYFEKQPTQSLEPFKFMTITCNVRSQYQQILPAVTHVDGTARPQVVDQQTNPKIYQVLVEFSKITGLHLLVNTSLNLHEEPINYLLDDSIRALKLNGFDILYFENYKITLKS